MTAWPTNLRMGPIREWPGQLLPQDKRRRSPFSASLTSTVELLDVELAAVKARNAELLIAMGPEQFRLDGYPRASAEASHPGVILGLTTAVGQLSYPCDTYGTWQGNLRAVALALEALRRIDRYGVTSRGEQYRGFLAVEQHPRTPVAEEAWLREYVTAPPQWTLADVLRSAKRKAHPDTGGDAATFAHVTAAERALTNGTTP